MRAINISNDKARNAQVGFEIKRNKDEVLMARPDGRKYANVRLLKSTIDTETEDLIGEFGSSEELANAIIKGDPEVDIEKVGMMLNGVKKVFFSSDNKIAYSINREEIVFTPDGQEKEVRKYSDTESNINGDIPIRWTGKLIPKKKAIRMFVFSKKYQIKHINGLTYDFLYDMAKQLQEKDCLLLVGGGPKGIAPVVLSNGGTPYRAFLEGRIDGDKYCLIMHLTNLELKSI